MKEETYATPLLGPSVFIPTMEVLSRQVLDVAKTYPVAAMAMTKHIVFAKATCY